MFESEPSSLVQTKTMLPLTATRNSEVTKVVSEILCFLRQILTKLNILKKSATGDFPADSLAA